jgi:pimeloyl-ACP methyl ester carboxylesterase
MADQKKILYGMKRILYKHDTFSSFLRRRLCRNSRSVLFLSVMPVPDQVRDDQRATDAVSQMRHRLEGGNPGGFKLDSRLRGSDNHFKINLFDSTIDPISNIESRIGMQRQDCTFQQPDGAFHYIDWGGSGPLAHFSHATGLCAGAYAPLASILLPKLHILGMDDRGHGQTRIAADPAKLTDWNIFADDLESFVDHLAKPVVAMGHSRGAVVSLMLAIKRPDLIRALVLIDPTILPSSWMWWWYLAKRTGLARWIPIAATAAKRRSTWPDRESILNSYRQKAVFSTWQEGFLEAYITDGTEKSGQNGFRLSCEPAWESKCFATCSHDIWRYIPRLKLPVLIVYGAKSDTFLAPAAKRFQSEVPHAKFKCFEKSGHFVPMEQPEATAEAIFDFLEGEAIN